GDTPLRATPKAQVNKGAATVHSDTTLEAINLTVRRLIAESLQRPIEEVRLDASLDDSGLALDSLSLVTLNVALEERYDITLPDFISEEARTVRSVRAIAELIASRIAESTKEGAPVGMPRGPARTAMRSPAP